MTETDVLLFAQALTEWGVARGFYAALSPRQEHLDPKSIDSVAIGTHGLALDVYEGVSAFLKVTVIWSTTSIEEILSRLPDRFRARMHELEVPADVQQEWASRFEREEGG